MRGKGATAFIVWQWVPWHNPQGMAAQSRSVKSEQRHQRNHRESSQNREDTARTAMRLALSLTVLASASGLLLSPHRFISRAPAVRMDECASASDRIAKLDAALERLQAAPHGQSAPARLLCLLVARLAALGSSALP